MFWCDLIRFSQLMKSNFLLMQGLQSIILFTASLCKNSHYIRCYFVGYGRAWFFLRIYCHERNKILKISLVSKKAYLRVDSVIYLFFSRSVPSNAIKVTSPEESFVLATGTPDGKVSMFAVGLIYSLHLPWKRKHKILEVNIL